MTNPPIKLLKKIAAIRSEVARIEKSEFNQANNYHYAPDQKIKETFKPLMDKHSVVLQFSITAYDIVTIDAKGDRKAVYLVFVKSEYTFWDADSGESLSGQWVGDGQLRDDKGLYAAITGMQKYAIMSMMFMPTGDDPEDKRFDKNDKGRAPVGRSTSSVPPKNLPNDRLANQLEQELEQAGILDMQSIAQMRLTYGGNSDISKMKAPALKNYVEQLQAKKR